MNKNQLRETLRKHIHDAPYLDAGVERIVDQVVNPKAYSVFMSQIEDVVYKFLGVERPKTKEKNGACGLKDLLPKDLDPVSPESDKNSLKDESLESLDINDINNLDRKQDEKVDEQRPQDEEKDKNRVNSENGHISLEEKTSDEAYKILSKTGSNSNLNTSAKSDDKIDEEEEEVSPTFEPIDIMNLNESNISNDSHLSGISELTSHRSRSPDFSNELSRDNFEYSNQDSQLSKVSSDSRLSIVTDFGSSNHALTPVHDSSRDETTKDKYEVAKIGKDSFKAFRELDSSKNKTTKSFDFVKGKDVQDYKDFKSTKSVSSKENSRDATDSSIKDKYDHKSKEKSKDSESTKLSKNTKENTKEKSASKDAKYYKDKSNEKKRLSSEKYDKHSSEKYDKHSKSKPKDKIDQMRESSDKIKDISENLKDNASKLKDEKVKEVDKKENVNKEVKDLKDIYKEKIRELREKKELTEKEKLNRDKDVKLIKETKDRKDPPKDKKSNKKEHKSSSSSSSSKNPSINCHESKSSKTSEKIADGKDKRSDSKEKAKRDEKRLLKESKGKSHYSSKSDLSDKSDKSDSKKVSKSEKEDKSGKVDVKKDVKSGEKTTNGKKDAKSHLQQGKNSDRVEKSDGRKESKIDSPTKDKKRREDKKSKTKDDHSSLRKNSNDRRSTDRDGSNGSNTKTLPPSNSNSNVTSTKSSTSNLTKDNHVSNSSSETSDSIEETQVSDSKTSHQSNCKFDSHKISSQLPTNEKSHSKVEIDNGTYDKQKEEEENADPRDKNLPLKKRLLSDKDSESTPDVKLKKPKFAKNIHEAKKLMKIRKQMEKQKLKEDKKVAQEADQTSQSNTKNNLDNLEGVPDDERVQIIEIPDEEYEEPYPEKHEAPLMLDERSIIMPGTDSCANDLLKELRTRQSLSGMISNVPSVEEMQVTQDSKIDVKHDAQSNDSHIEGTEDSQASGERHKDDSEEDSKNKIKRTIVNEEKYRLQAEETRVSQKLEEAAASEKSESLSHNGNKNIKQSMEENTAIRDCNQAETVNDNEETKNDDTLKIRDDNKESDEKQIKMCVSSKADTIESHTDCMGNKSSSSAISEDNEDCRYFKTDNEKSEKFSNFLKSLELVENSSLEDIIESLGGQVVSWIPKPMAPPLPKLRKRSSSPLSDILVNNSDNNNDGHKKLSSSTNEDAVHIVKKRKFTKKPRFSSLCNPQGISNGENFVMPLSPDSDVSATSDKTASSNVMKEEKRYVTCFRDFYIVQGSTRSLLLFCRCCCCYYTCSVPVL